MSKVQRVRYFVLFLALSVVVVASIIPVEEKNEAGAGKPAAADRRRVKIEGKKEELANAKNELIDEDTVDPFIPHAWQPVVEALPVVKEVAAPIREQVPQPVLPVTPPLPFQYMGRLNDGDDQIIYLGRGEQTIVARVDDTIDGTFKLKRIGINEIEFVYLPTGETQVMSLDAAK